MIVFTYAISGLLIAVSGYLSVIGVLSALLTAGEIFPLEIRALAIAFFFAVGTGNAAAGPWLLATSIGERPESLLFGIYCRLGSDVCRCID
jgi:hypothetical protein